MGCRSSSTAVDPANGTGTERKSSGSTTLPDDSVRTGSDLPSVPSYPSALSPSNKSIPKLSLPYHFQEEIDEATKLAHALAAASVATSSVASTPVASLALSVARGANCDPPSSQVQPANEPVIPETDVYVTSIEEEELPAMQMHPASSLKTVEHVDEPSGHGMAPSYHGGNAELASLTSQEMHSVPSGTQKETANVRRHVSGLSSSSSSAEVCVESPGKVPLEREDSIEMLEAIPDPIFPPQEDNRWAVPMPGTIEDEDIPFPPAGPKPPHVGRRNDFDIDDEMLMNAIMTENMDTYG